MANEEINERQKLFCHNYLNNGFNKQKAAEDAGYGKKTASALASALLKNVKVKKYLDAIVDEVLMAKRNVLKVRVLDELEKIAFSDPTKDIKVVTRTDDEGKTYQYVEITDTKDSANTRAIAGMYQNNNGYIVVKYYDKPKALELLGRYLAMFTDRIEANVKGFITMDKLLDEASEDSN